MCGLHKRLMLLRMVLEPAERRRDRCIRQTVTARPRSFVGHSLLRHINCDGSRHRYHSFSRLRPPLSTRQAGVIRCGSLGPNPIHSHFDLMRRSRFRHQRNGLGTAVIRNFS